MCGFAGIIHWDKGPVAASELAEMASLLRHRGPDEQNHQIPAAGVGFSHCRLKVIDLSSAARQPMAGESGETWVLFNGEIYNFRELRRELSSAGCRFRSQSDTEVILRAYEHWGADGIRRLDGMFSLAIWDGGSRTLILGRDRTGKKPLYYWTNGRCVTFGSEIKALRVHPHVPNQLEEELVPYLLAFGSLPADRSFYRGIRQVPPATILQFSEDHPEPSANMYWKLPPAEEDLRRTPQQAESELRELLTAAVKRRLVSDVPLGAFLSGGIDSTIVVGLMSEQLKGDPVRTFSVGFEGDERFNETSFAQAAADRFKTRHTAFSIGPQPFDLIEKLVWHHDQPFGDSSALPTYLLSQQTRAHVTVALTGDGGDELFAGYDRFRAALLGEACPGWIWKGGSFLLRPVRRGAWCGDRRKSPRGLLLPQPAFSRKRWHIRSFANRLRRFLQAADRPLPERYLWWRSILPQPEQFLISPAAVSPLPAMEKEGSPLDRLLRLNFAEYLPCDLHIKVDRCSMAHGLETRSPFLDTALMEWAFRLPDSWKLRGGRGKWILRRAFRDLLPPAIERRSKMGFGVPLGAWFRGAWREPLMDYLVSPEARFRRYLDGKKVDTLVRSHLNGEEDAGHALWLFLTFEIWLRQNSRADILEAVSSHE